jgi:hypothetical protein
MGKTMGEFLKECFLTVNLPVTVMLLTVLGYWLMVIVGVLGLDALDLDLDADADIDADVDGGGWLGSALEFLYLGDVPVVIVGSFFVVFMWIATLLSNHYLNEQHSILMMALWFIPNVILSLLLTRVSMMPFATMFKNYDKTDFTRENMVGKIGIVKTSEVTCEFGQIEIQQAGPPMVINVRTEPGTRLRQGDAAKIVSFNNMNDTFLVELSKWEKE